jgi:RNAse (barnase) inhibitor barstar
MDEAVRRYLDLLDEGKSPLTAALAVKNEYGAALDELHDALMERGLL